MSRQHDLQGATDARMYDYMLGGKDHLAVDRAAVELLRTQTPGVVEAFVHNRRFVHRAVGLLAGGYGIDQFVDLGCGLPSTLNVHQVAHQYRPTAQVVYVDNDPIVMAHVHALLATDRHTTGVDGDITAADRVLARVDLSAPVAVLLTAVAHLLDDRALARTLEAIASLTVSGGGYLVFTQLVGASAEAAAELETLSTSAQTPRWRIRTPADVDTLLRRWSPLPPGLGDVSRWRHTGQLPAPATAQAGESVESPGTQARWFTYGGVLRRRSR